MYSLGFLTVSLLLFIGVVYWLAPLRKAQKSVFAYKYDAAAESSSKNEAYDELFKMDSLVTLTIGNRTINVNGYVAEADFQLFDIGDLGSAGLIISERVAEKLNVSEGDILFADLSVFEAPKQYKVIKTIPYLMDFYDISANKDFSVVVFGDRELESSASGFYVHFLRESDVASYKSLNSYRRVFDINQEMTQIEQYICIIEGAFITAWCLLAILFLVFVHQRILAETVKYYHGGYTIKDVSFINTLDHLLVMGIPLLIIAVYLIYGMNSQLLSVWMVIIPLTILAALLLFWSGGKTFGKSTGV